MRGQYRGGRWCCGVFRVVRCRWQLKISCRRADNRRVASGLGANVSVRVCFSSELKISGRRADNRRWASGRGANVSVRVVCWSWQLKISGRRTDT